MTENNSDDLLPYEFYFPDNSSMNPEAPTPSSSSTIRSSYNKTCFEQTFDPKPSKEEGAGYFFVDQWISRNPTCAYYCGLLDPLPPPHPLPFPKAQTYCLQLGQVLTYDDLHPECTRNYNSLYPHDDNPFNYEIDSDPIPLELISSFYAVLRWKGRNPYVPLLISFSL